MNQWYIIVGNKSKWLAVTGKLSILCTCIISKIKLEFLDHI